MKGCLSCTKCNGVKLIPDVYIGKPTMVKIRCTECDYDGKSAETTEEAIRNWNSGR